MYTSLSDIRPHASSAARQQALLHTQVSHYACMLFIHTPHPWLVFDHFSLVWSFRPAASALRYRQAEQRLLPKTDTNTAHWSLRLNLWVHSLPWNPGVCVCVCAHIPPWLHLAQQSDNAGDRPRAPLLYCSRQLSMLTGAKLSSSVGNVITAICTPKALAHAPERPAVRAESTSRPLMGIFRSEIHFTLLQVRTQRRDCRLLYQLFFFAFKFEACIWHVLLENT